MRVLIMERMHTMRLIMEKWTGEVFPKIQSILEHTKDQQRFWHVIPAGESKFEVRKGYDAFTVDEGANTCSCKMWQILGLPCVHAVACISKLNKMVEPYVLECFKIEMFKHAYTQFMKPVEGITFWADCTHLSRILGPLPKKMPGRPKKRIRASHESLSTTKISRSAFIGSTSSSPRVTRQIMNEPPPPQPQIMPVRVSYTVSAILVNRMFGRKFGAGLGVYALGVHIGAATMHSYGTDFVFSV
nr:pentatricopeptide repeat-containing protein [Tanacetum cinerariifolium]